MIVTNELNQAIAIKRSNTNNFHLKKLIFKKLFRGENALQLMDPLTGAVLLV